MKCNSYFVQQLEELFLTTVMVSNIMRRVREVETQEYIEWSFIALGRVLHFFKSNSVKDMNDDACKELHMIILLGER
ncbi:hypothetical protein Ahy_A02g005063 [Arachis hypogaea]|uniref:Uncharacterized protein n=1 Tax=Arachis hypogaea TaxID=3818 RepID=A0A445E5J9_ARAHY|nr:hypothetical protein Ahy_A02g005063 [Arachis hypogaea]